MSNNYYCVYTLYFIMQTKHCKVSNLFKAVQFIKDIFRLFKIQDPESHILFGGTQPFRPI